MYGLKLFREISGQNDNNNILCVSRYIQNTANSRTFIYYSITHLYFVFSLFLHPLCII